MCGRLPAAGQKRGFSMYSFSLFGSGVFYETDLYIPSSFEIRKSKKFIVRDKDHFINFNLFIFL